jgi:hypothetical protein
MAKTLATLCAAAAIGATALVTTPAAARPYAAPSIWAPRSECCYNGPRGLFTSYYYGNWGCGSYGYRYPYHQGGFAYPHSYGGYGYPYYYGRYAHPDRHESYGHRPYYTHYRRYSYRPIRPYYHGYRHPYTRRRHSGFY